MKFALSLLVVCIGATVAWSQTNVPSKLAFDVVAVKPVPPGRDELFDSYCAGGGRFITRGTPLLFSIAWAYGVNKDLIYGAPGWLNSFRTYDIEASADGPMTQENCRAMVRSLFEDRFGLRMRKETRTVPVFALTVAKNGPKFRVGDRVAINGAVKQVTTERGDPVGWTMGRLANYLSSAPAVQRPVIDRTELGGMYAFTLNYSTGSGDDRADVFAALPDQLGLRLEAARAPVDVWVVERVERPGAN